MADNEERYVVLDVRFKGEEKSSYFCISLDNSKRFGVNESCSLFEFKDALKDFLADKFKEKSICELIIVDDVNDDINKVLVLDTSCIAFFSV